VNRVRLASIPQQLAEQASSPLLRDSSIGPGKSKRHSKRVALSDSKWGHWPPPYHIYDRGIDYRFWLPDRLLSLEIAFASLVPGAIFVGQSIPGGLFITGAHL
jgi:hypothetical protein